MSFPSPVMTSSVVAGPAPFASSVLCGHTPLFFRDYYINPLSVEYITAIGIQAKCYLRTRWDFASTGDTIAQDQTRRIKEQLLVCLNQLGTLSKIKWVNSIPDSGDLDVVFTPHTQDATFTPISVCSPSLSSFELLMSFKKPVSKRGDTFDEPASPSPSITNFLSDESNFDLPRFVSACTPSVVPTTPAPVDSSLNINPTPSGLLSSGSSPPLWTAPSGLDNPADSIVPPVDAPSSGDVQSNKLNDDSTVQVELPVDDEAVRVEAITVFDVCSNFQI
ncbi:hypothetical protein EV421DRAFT_1913321 [Armillaria borealis]|uniref:Uncharacterized protein n=1 Tax=Armillaria borealis TaxID=47425 RepID=A0AA39ITC3_9AGAR|nr:hypothetical protein EV421DRAFT_1913321 [Armillaria borealis]